MATFTVSRDSSKSQKALWDVLADYPNIAEWNPDVKTSFSTSSATSGVGAKRVCELAPAGKVDESVLEWVEPTKMVIAIEKASKLPIKSTVTTFTVTSAGNGVKLGTHVNFVPKGGPVGKLFSPVLALGLKKGMNRFLESWDDAA